MVPARRRGRKTGTGQTNGRRTKRARTTAHHLEPSPEPGLLGKGILETLPAEILSNIFFYALEPNLIFASPIFAAIASGHLEGRMSPRRALLYASLCHRDVWPEDNFGVDAIIPAELLPFDEDLQTRWQEAVLRSRWCNVQWLLHLQEAVFHRAFDIFADRHSDDEIYEGWERWRSKCHKIAADVLQNAAFDNSDLGFSLLPPTSQVPMCWHCSIQGSYPRFKSLYFNGHVPSNPGRVIRKYRGTFAYEHFRLFNVKAIPSNLWQDSFSDKKLELLEFLVCDVEACIGTKKYCDLVAFRIEDAIIHKERATLRLLGKHGRASRNRILKRRRLGRHFQAELGKKPVTDDICAYVQEVNGILDWFPYKRGHGIYDRKVLYFGEDAVECGLKRAKRKRDPTSLQKLKDLDSALRSIYAGRAP